MAAVHLNPIFGIRSISGKLGNCIFYTRNGKQYVRRATKNAADLPSFIDPSSTRHQSIIDPSSTLTPS